MCGHKNLRTVGHRLFCQDCKIELPIEFLTQGNKPEEAPDKKPAPKRKRKGE